MLIQWFTVVTANLLFTNCPNPEGRDLLKESKQIVAGKVRKTDDPPLGHII